MATYAIKIFLSPSLCYSLKYEPTNPNYSQFLGYSLLSKPTNFMPLKSHYHPIVATSEHVEIEVKVKEEEEEEKPRFRWTEVGPYLTEAQKKAVSDLPRRMTKRCKAVMRQIIYFSDQKAMLSDVLSAWVSIMKPRRSDWLSVLRELKSMQHPFYVQVAEFALLEESYEANVRDYTKLIHYYGKQNHLHEAESTLLAMKRAGFECDQVTLTAMIVMYGKAGNLRLAEETFEELKLLGEPLDKRSYGSMIMAYIRAGKLEEGETILREMDSQETRAGTEVYKALLRAYSLAGDTEGAQRVFDAIQFAGIPPDVRLCGLLINAYRMAGQSKKARIAFINMCRAGLQPSDKCVALVLAAYEQENKLDTALEFLVVLESEGVMIGKEASEVLVGWFRRLGVVKDVELILSEFAAWETNNKLPAA